MSMAHGNEISYVLLIFALFVVPHFFHKVKLPAAIVALLLGIFAKYFDLFKIDATISLMSTIGISALFLFAGMEIDFTALRREYRLLMQQVIISLLLLVCVAVGIDQVFGVGWRAATIASLALVTPSTGFIIDSLHQLKLSTEQLFLVKAIAIGTEIVALGIMFIVLQSNNLQTFGFNTVALVAVILALPLLFWMFAKLVTPYAPNADFAFFLMLAIICGVITKKLGAYYLIGAFVVGVVGQRFQGLLSNRETEHTLQSLRLFSGFFIPFYFFKAGLTVQPETLFSFDSVAVALLLFVTIVPLRTISFTLYNHLFVGARLKDSFDVAISILPTLVFGLVLVSILSNDFSIPAPLLNGLTIYTLLISIVPRFFQPMHAPSKEEPKPEQDSHASV